MDSESKALMMKWERPLMEAHTRAVCSSGGGDYFDGGCFYIGEPDVSFGINPFSGERSSNWNDESADDAFQVFDEWPLQDVVWDEEHAVCAAEEWVEMADSYEITGLPEELLSAAIFRTSPCEAYRTSTVSPVFRANVLSATDLALYEQLELEGKLLEGEDLDFAFDSILAFSEIGENQEDSFLSEESLEDIRDSKLALRAEVSDLEKQLASLEWQLDLLTAQATTITQGKKSRSAAETGANEQLRRLDEELAKRSLEMNAVLGKLATTTQELSYYHSEADVSIYSSYCDFQFYVFNNLTCTKELNKWFTKKFEKGPLQFVVKEDMSRGDSEKSHHFVVELCRMIQTLEQILSVPLTYVQPKLTPWPLAQALEELEIVNQQVSACVNEVTMARDEKAEMLQQPSRNVEQAFSAFSGIAQPDAYPYTALISGLPTHGHAKLALQVFERIQAQEVRLDPITKASDVLDKLRYLSVTDLNLLKDGPEFDIWLYVQWDSGIRELFLRMQRQRLRHCLGASNVSRGQ